MIKPRALRPGDRIAAISLSSGWPNVFGKRQLEETFSVQVIESRHALAGPDWLAAHPEGGGATGYGLMLKRCLAFSRGRFHIDRRFSIFVSMSAVCRAIE